jgi:hypothetical protein
MAGSQSKSAKKDCGGEVKITVKDDNSHSSKMMKGQKIIVKIEHPPTVV